MVLKCEIGMEKACALVARDVDGDNVVELEVPTELWASERSDEATRGGIHMDADLPSVLFVNLLNCFVHALNILKLSSIGGAKNANNPCAAISSGLAVVLSSSDPALSNGQQCLISSQQKCARSQDCFVFCLVF